jgi:hypothetical protein
MSPIIEGHGLGTPIQSAGAPTAGTDEVQTLTIGGTPTGGTFTLSFQGLSSNAIAWTSVNATLLATIQSALQAIPSIGGGNATATAGTLTAGIGTVLITFVGSLAKKAVPNVAIADNSLTGTSPTLAVAETTPGVDVTGRSAPKGALLIDTTNGALFQNTGTAASPVWTAR